MPVLLSIDSMYAELLEASSDEAREECIRESFPNEQLMTQALLAMIELLDPSIDVNDPGDSRRRFGVSDQSHPVRGAHRYE